MPRLTRNTSTGMVLPYLDEYLTYCQREALTKRGRPLAPSTVQAVKTRLRTVLARLPAGTDLLTVLADRRATEALLDTLLTSMAQGSARNVVTNLRSYQAFLMERGYIGALTLTQRDVPTYRRARDFHAYSDEDVAKLAQAASYVGVRYHLAVVSLLDTGLRIGELLSLEWSGIDLDGEVPTYHLPTSKTGEPRTVVLTPNLVRLWRGAPTTDLMHGRAEPVRISGTRIVHWPRDTRRYPFPYAYSTFAASFRDLCFDAEVEYQGVHAARHAFAMRLVKQGADVLAVSRLLGHSTIQTTAHYYARNGATDFARHLGWEDES